MNLLKMCLERGRWVLLVSAVLLVFGCNQQDGQPNSPDDSLVDEIVGLDPQYAKQLADALYAKRGIEGSEVQERAFSAGVGLAVDDARKKIGELYERNLSKEELREIHAFHRSGAGKAYNDLLRSKEYLAIKDELNSQVHQHFTDLRLGRYSVQE